MCGRFTLTPTAVTQLAGLFDLVPEELPPLEGRYNVAPTQGVAAIRNLGDPPHRRLDLLRWGLVPSWSKDPKKGPLLINARADTVAEKPSFRGALKHRRCLVPADGFFEWRTEGKQKQPMYFRLPGGAPFALAGLWEHWEGNGDVIESVTLLTTDANATVSPVHDRMPVILPRGAYDTWLDPAVHDLGVLVPMLAPYPAEGMTATPVNPRVNNARNDDPTCLEPLLDLGLG